MSKTSVVVFTHNEQATIKDCLSSASWADEIILVDDYSTDQTLKIAQNFSQVKIYQRKLDDFASQHNFGLKKTKKEWVFFLDADERISKKLAQKIQALSKNKSSQPAYQVKRLNLFLGKMVQHGGWSPDYPTRFFKKDQLKGWQGKIHESAVFKGKAGVIKAPLYHFTHRSLKKMLKKTINWSVLEAQLRLNAGHPQVNPFRVLKVGLQEFYKRFLKHCGYKDGMVGWLESLYQSMSMMITYLQLWERQR